MQKEFANQVISIIRDDPQVVGLAAGGSWISGELDEYSDLDLILVTKNKISDSPEKMIVQAKKLGKYISGFTGEHVGESRLLICLFDDPLLHVDIKFLTIEELKDRIEDPVILFERENRLSNIIKSTEPVIPSVDLQWIENRFWTWIHYSSTKIARGEYFEVLSSIDFLRLNVLAPMMQLKNQRKIRGTRKVELEIHPSDIENLKITVAKYDKLSLIKSLDNIISIYKSLRRKLFDDNIQRNELAEKKSLEYFKKIKN